MRVGHRCAQGYSAAALFAIARAALHLHLHLREAHLDKELLPGDALRILLRLLMGVACAVGLGGA